MSESERRDVQAYYAYLLTCMSANSEGDVHIDYQRRATGFHLISLAEDIYTEITLNDEENAPLYPHESAWARIAHSPAPGHQPKRFSGRT